ncbi:MAG: M23 family metallopeptidase [Gemmatimonadetes bacterium]|nr:M23 family metallopeptidase [Gemmatimonadota bacterium]
MTGDRWTFLVVRGEDSPVRQYSLSSRMLRALVGGGSVLALVLVTSALTVGVDGYSRIRAEKLEARNAALQTELARFQGRIDGIESTIDAVAKNDARFRSIAGLESIDPEVLQLGVGGPGLGSPDTYPLWPIDSIASKTAFAVSYDLNALERRANLLSASLNEATDSVLAHRDLMESTPSILPTVGWLSSSFSASRMHPIHNRALPHEGMDISATKGTSIFAAAKGRVVRSGWVVGYGLTIEIDHGFGYTTLYGHASKLVSQRGQEVQRGDVIAQVGSTGIATSAHLHYEVRVNGVAQNPANFILPETVRY